MAIEVRLPQLGQTMEEGTIVNALVSEGDKVSKGDCLFEIETDKATLEMESPAEGFVKKILIEVGATVPVNTAILLLGDEDEEVEGDVVSSATSESAAPSEPSVSSAPESTDTPAAQSTVAAQSSASAKVVRLPQLGQTMEEGTIVNALVAEGDKVNKGDCLFEIETDKATLEMESPAEGYVKKVLVEVGATVPVNAAILVLGDEDEDVDQGFIDSLAGAGAAQPEQIAAGGAGASDKAGAAAPKSATAAGEGERVFASPRARMLAGELGVDLAAVAAAGDSIVAADVLKAASAGGVETGSGIEDQKYRLGQKVSVSRLQKIVGERMVQSKREIPCFYLTVRADVTKLVELRTKMNKAGGEKVSFNDFIIRAVALGLERYPVMTGQLVGDHIQLAAGIDIGLAISVDDGLVAPLVKDAHKKSLAEIAAYGKGLVERARNNKLSL
ncbi:MAG: 2-oxo acid dehydrogenase subunit E2, partial [Planctomycetes bacterium]|nr:2-oxo acid dehydrogenase subunit E2 [Planctomycetota bacterium]